MKLRDEVPIKISVTKEDIENGIPNISTCCPIALAVCRALDMRSEDLELEVDGNINIYSSSARIYIDKDLDDFVRKFDREELVFPFEFTMTASFPEPDWDLDFGD